MNLLFFELIRVSIGTSVCLSHTPTADEWQMLYDMAKKQTIMGVCFYGVQLLKSQGQCPPKQLYNQWMVAALFIKQRNERLNQQCVDLQKRLSFDGLRSSILKGQGIAVHYGQILSEFRQPGDIDVYVDCGREKAIDYAKSLQKNVDWDYKHLHLKVFSDTEVEVHYVADVMLNPWLNNKLQKYWKTKEEDIFGKYVTLTNGSEITVPTLEFNCSYVLMHIYRHMFGEGVGLRQLMDYYFVLLAYAEQELTQAKHESSITYFLDQFGLKTFTAGILWVMEYVFGDKTILHTLFLMNFGIVPDEEEGKFLLNEIMQSGNFGQHDVRYSRGKTKAGFMKNVIKRNLHLLRHYPSESLAAPCYYVWHFLWKLKYTNKLLQ